MARRHKVAGGATRAFHTLKGPSFDGCKNHDAEQRLWKAA